MNLELAETPHIIVGALVNLALSLGIDLNSLGRMDSIELKRKEDNLRFGKNLRLYSLDNTTRNYGSMIGRNEILLEPLGHRGTKPQGIIPADGA